MQQSRCVRCQSDKMIPDLQIVDQMGHYLRLAVSVNEHPEAMMFKGKHYGPVRARVCGSCGYLETYVENPAESYDAYLASQAS